MRPISPLLFLLCLLPGSLAAHPGHLADVAGHDHWVAGAAIGIAILTGLWAAWKGKGKAETEDEAEEAEGDEQEQAA